MQYTWREPKRRRNLKLHDFDFADGPAVFAGATYTYEDDRMAYREQRFVTLGLLNAVPVSIVHTETEHEIHIISFRKATRRETTLYFNAL